MSTENLRERGCEDCLPSAEAIRLGIDQPVTVLRQFERNQEEYADTFSVTLFGNHRNQIGVFEEWSDSSGHG